MRRLEAEGRNGVWGRIIKNAFAPVFRAAIPFDYVVGNPPWVNWESLADDYREATKRLWQRYGLLTGRGQLERMQAGKKDIAMLMLYAAADSYLRGGGKLGFVITQTVFKTKGAGDGFRRFRLGEDGLYLKVLSAQDMAELQPFEGATNRTATVVLQKGEPTEYPVSYTVWQKARPGKIGVDLSLKAVEERTRKASLSARPVDSAQPTSPWLTASPAVLATLQKAIGPSPYQAHAGACTWANGVYWLRVLERQPGGLLLVENLHDVGKIKVKRLEASMEPDLVYPLLRGRDISRWKATPSAHILMVQDPVKRTGYEEAWLKVNYPHTYAYLKEFEDVLRQRSGYKKYFDPAKDAFYSMYDVAEYTVAPYKVVWPWIATGLRAAVAGRKEGQVVIPEHIASFVPFTNEAEAHYFCSLLGSASADMVIRARTPGGGGGLASPSILQHVAIPRFDRSDPLHQSLSSLSQRAHQLAAKGKDPGNELIQVEEEIDRKAAELWGITTKELAEIRRSLHEL